MVKSIQELKTLKEYYEKEKDYVSAAKVSMEIIKAKGTKNYVS